MRVTVADLENLESGSVYVAPRGERFIVVRGGHFDCKWPGCSPGRALHNTVFQTPPSGENRGEVAVWYCQRHMLAYVNNDGTDAENDPVFIRAIDNLVG